MSVFRRFWEQTHAVQTQDPVWGASVQSGVLGLRKEIPWGNDEALQFPNAAFSHPFLNNFDPLIWFLVFLQILSVDQWGLEVSLLPSLAVCGPGSLDLQSSQDPSVLCFGTKGKSTLQAGSALGLMAYLYARYYWWGFNRCVRTIAFLQSRHEAVQIVIMSQSVVSPVWSVFYYLPFWYVQQRDFHKDWGQKITKWLIDVFPSSQLQ